MKNLSLGLMVAFTTTVLSGCALYFGEDDHNNDTWTYCGSDGYYTCDGDNCQWVGSSCPDQGSGSGSSQPGGFDCRDNSDCAAGCYCANGTCEEAGFCTTDADCGTGYTCNEDRSSCEPGTPPCTADTDCDSGSVCTNGACTATCVCSTDAEAAAQGYAYCDEARITCMSGTDPAGTCGGEPTCNQLPPTCAAGDVPLLGDDGCWNGQCEAASQCAVAPSCSHIHDEATCLAQSGCAETVNGINCKKPDGTACMAGSANCSCDSYVFAACRSATP